MKTLGAILMVSGLLISITGYGLYSHVACHCAIHTGFDQLGCHCGNVLQQDIGHILVYMGLAIAGSGMIVFTKWWRKKIVFN